MPIGLDFLGCFLSIYMWRRTPAGVCGVRFGSWHCPVYYPVTSHLLVLVLEALRYPRTRRDRKKVAWRWLHISLHNRHHTYMSLYSLYHITCCQIAYTTFLNVVGLDESFCSALEFLSWIRMLTQWSLLGDGEYMDETHHHHHQQAPAGPASGGSNDIRPAHVFSGYPQQYPSNAAQGSATPSLHDGLNGSHHNPIAARRYSRNDDDEENNPPGLFPDCPEAKKRKFILVDDIKRGCRLRVRVELENINTKEIPDSFRRRTSVYPRSFFPREMQSPPPSTTGRGFFQDDLSDDDVEVDGGRTGRTGRLRGKATRNTVMVLVPMADGTECEIAVPRMRRSIRRKEMQLNDIGQRLSWRHSRAFSGKISFLQRACRFSLSLFLYFLSFVPTNTARHPVDCYRNKTRDALANVGKKVRLVAPHFETRVGKRRWLERMARLNRQDE